MTIIDDQSEWLEADGLGGLGPDLRHSHAPLPRAPLDRDNAADRPHGARERLRRLGDDRLRDALRSPVEVQALWLNALWIAATLDPRWRLLFERGRQSF